MKLEKVLKKATPLPLELIVGEGTCFHEGNTVSIQKLHEPSEDNGFEGAGETIAEFWSGQNDIDKVDGALLLHCRKKFPKLLNAMNQYLDDTAAVEGDHVCVVCGNTLEYSKGGDVQQCIDADCLRVMILNAVSDAEEVEGI